MPRKPQPAPLDGALVIDKPRGRTSHDVVEAVRRILGFRQIGHLGTLDPLATGRAGAAARARHAPRAILCGPPQALRLHVPLRLRHGHLRRRWRAARPGHGSAARSRRNRAARRRARRPLSANAAALFREENSRPPGARTRAQEKTGGTESRWRSRSTIFT